jgi:hypothetical protein
VQTLWALASRKRGLLMKDAGSMTKWQVGDRVMREIYLDNGMWAVKGDACLPGPLKRGRVVSSSVGDRGDVLYTVEWEPYDGCESRHLRQGRFLAHGLYADLTWPLKKDEASTMTETDRNVLLAERERLNARMKEIDSALVCGALVRINGFPAECKCEGAHAGPHTAQFLWPPTSETYTGTSRPWTVEWYTDKGKREESHE